MSRVLICDDAVAFSVMFRRWMADCGLEVVGQAQTAGEAVKLAAEQRPNVIVIDHLLRDGTSDILTPQLREAAPDAKVLLISGMPDDLLAEAAEAAGADGHLSKLASGQEMCDAVRALLA